MPDPVGERMIDGYRGLTIASAAAELEATFVPDAGMVCCSLRHRGEEILGQRNGLAGYVGRKSTMGTPLLYPWANRLSRDRLTVGGGEIDLRGEHEPLKRDGNGLPIHGLLTAARGWEVVRHEPLGSGAVLTARFEWERSPERYRLFPFAHTLRLEATLSDEGLELATTIEPDRGVTLPVAFGFHPYLTLPGTDRTEWHLGLPVGERLELDGRGLPTGERQAAASEDGALGERSFDDLYVAPAASAPLAISGGGRRIELSLDAGFPYTQIYAPAREQLIALDPMTVRTDALSSPERGDPLLTEEPFAAAFRITVNSSAADGSA